MFKAKGTISRILRIKNKPDTDGFGSVSSTLPKPKTEVKWLLLFNGNSRPDHKPDKVLVVWIIL